MYFIYPDSLHNPVLLPAEEHHLKNVCRARVGETVYLSDNQGALLVAKIAALSPLIFASLQQLQNFTPPDLTVYVPLIEETRLEWLAEKLCEMGVKNLSLIITDRTQKKKLSERKFERLKKMALVAQKQCARPYPLNIFLPIEFSEVIQQVQNIYFGDLNAGKEPLKFGSNTPVIVGPEGGFTDSELKLLQKKGQGIHLAGNVLRAETAALCLASKLLF